METQPTPESNSMFQSEVRQPPTLVTQDRMTVTLQAHHESYGEEPHSVHWVFADLLESKEQPYTRRIEVTEEGIQLDFGWLKDKFGQLLLINKASTKHQVQPTPEEKAEEQKKELLVFQSGGLPWRIKPGRLHFGQPDTNQIELKSVHGTIPVTVVIFPR